MITIPTHKGSGGRPKIFYNVEVNGKIYLIGTQHRLYNLRYKMMARCYDAKPSEYACYQGKGIAVCDEWRNNPASFFEWCLSNEWKKGLQLDRINPEGNYEPSNVKIATPSENARRAQVGRFGETAGNVKLDAEKVIKIKEMLKDKKSSASIAREFDVSPPTIRRLRDGKTWSHIEI